jgi:hypothetical protein
VADRWALEPYTTRAASEIERLHRAIESREKAEARALREADEARLSATERTALALAEEYDFSSARRAIEEILNGGAVPRLEVESVQERARQVLEDYRHLVALKNKVVSEAKSKQGKVKVEHKGRQVTVMGGDDEFIEINMGGAMTRLRWKSFDKQEFFDAASAILSPCNPDDHLRLGVFAVVLGLVDQVESELGYAAREGNASVAREAERYLRRFHSGSGKAGEQLEAEAQARFREIVNLFLQAEQELDHAQAVRLLGEALRLFETWKSEFAQTRFAKERESR